MQPKKVDEHVFPVSSYVASRMIPGAFSGRRVAVIDIDAIMQENDRLPLLRLPTTIHHEIFSYLDCGELIPELTGTCQKLRQLYKEYRAAHYYRNAKWLDRLLYKARGDLEKVPPIYRRDLREYAHTIPALSLKDEYPLLQLKTLLGHFASVKSLSLKVDHLKFDAVLSLLASLKIAQAKKRMSSDAIQQLSLKTDSLCDETHSLFAAIAEACPHLTSLNARFRQPLDARALVQIAKIKYLKELYLYGTSTMEDKDFEVVKDLRVEKLAWPRSSKLTDKGLSALVTCWKKTLSSVELHLQGDEQITQKGLIEFISSLTRLIAVRIWDSSDSQASDDLVGEIAKHSELTMIDIRGEGLTNASLAILAKATLPDLKILRLSSSKFSEEGIKYLAQAADKFQLLDQFRLSNYESQKARTESAALPLFLSTLKNLKILELRNQYAGPLTALAISNNCPKLKYLNIIGPSFVTDQMFQYLRLPEAIEHLRLLSTGISALAILAKLDRLKKLRALAIPDAGRYWGQIIQTILTHQRDLEYLEARGVFDHRAEMQLLLLKNFRGLKMHHSSMPVCEVQSEALLKCLSKLSKGFEAYEGELYQQMPE